MKTKTQSHDTERDAIAHSHASRCPHDFERPPRNFPRSKRKPARFAYLRSYGVSVNVQSILLMGYPGIMFALTVNGQ